MTPSLRNIQILACAVCCFYGCAKSAPSVSHDSGEPSASHSKQLPEAKQFEEPSRKNVIAKVLGKEILDEDLGQNPMGMTASAWREFREFRLKSLIFMPLMRKYCANHQIQAAPEEVEQYKEAMKKLTPPEFSMDDLYLEALRESLTLDELPEAEKNEVSELIELLEAEGDETMEQRLIRRLRGKLDSHDLLEAKRHEYAEELERLEEMEMGPEAAVKEWKFDRALYAQYGGRVVFHQWNLAEPIGAYRSWLEEQVQAGDFEILDRQARARFWKHYDPNLERTPWELSDRDPFDKPWWLKTPPKED